MSEVDRRKILTMAGALAAAPVLAQAQPPAGGAPGGAAGGGRGGAAGGAAGAAGGRGGAPAGGGGRAANVYDPNAPLGVQIGTIERMDPELDALVDNGAPILRISNVEGNAEGPCWVPLDGGYLVYSDPPQNKMHKWDPKTGQTTVFRSPAGLDTPLNPTINREAGSNGIHYWKGSLIYADSGSRAIMQLDLKTMKRTVVADNYMGKKFNSPNDLAIAKDGTIFFTDPPYGFFPAVYGQMMELDFKGVFRIDAKTRAVTVVDRNTGPVGRMPNGIAISPDGTKLYTSDTGGDGRNVYDLTKDNIAINKRPFLTGFADGFKTDASGCIWSASIFNPSGKQIGRVNGGNVSNCYFAKDGYLYLTMGHSVGRVKTKTKPIPQDNV